MKKIKCDIVSHFPTMWQGWNAFFPRGAKLSGFMENILIPSFLVLTVCSNSAEEDGKRGNSIKGSFGHVFVSPLSIRGNLIAVVVVSKTPQKGTSIENHIKATAQQQQILGFLWSTNQPLAHQRTQKKEKHSTYLAMVFITFPPPYALLMEILYGQTY